MNRRSSVLVLFGSAVAALSAAVADLLVETLANHGVFGPGNFTDGSTLDVAPVTIIGMVIFGAFVWRHIAHAMRDISATLSTRLVMRILPAIFAGHMFLLFLMESLEQRVVLGCFLGGTIWLGAPTIASLVLHAIICAIVLVFALGAIRFLEPRAVRFIRTLLASVCPPTAPVACLRRMLVPSTTCRILLHEVAKRGPPAADLSV